MYKRPEVRFGDGNVLQKGGNNRNNGETPSCTIGAAVMFGVAAIVWNAAVVWNWAATAVAAVAAAAAVTTVAVTTSSDK